MKILFLYLQTPNALVIGIFQANTCVNGRVHLSIVTHEHDVGIR